MRPCFLFDLDGTVADNGEGILKSAQYALDAFGFPNQPEEKLRLFVGPPLDQSFRELYGMSQEEALRAIAKYRERYSVTGVLENHLYPGISELLRDLAQIGQVCLATSKPQVFAEKILETRGVRQYFSLVVGAELSGERTEKGEVIEAALQGLGDPPRDWAVMIGDRKFDVEAGQALGLVTVGVDYGYAPPGEMDQCRPAYRAATVEELAALLKAWAAGKGETER